jgi:DNA-binding GntR family transcriptional regulator
MPGLPTAKVISIRERVGEIIRQALNQGRFKPGQALSEAGLAAEMAISRGPVREALFLLAQEGLVSHSPNRGFSVVQFTETDQREVNNVRLPLEALALDLARRSVRAEDLTQLDAIKQEMIRAYEAREWRFSCEADMRFHSRIWEIGGNSRLLMTLRNLMAPYFAYGAVFSASRSGPPVELLDQQHSSYIEFLGGLCSWRAEECVRFHLTKRWTREADGSNQNANSART